MSEEVQGNLEGLVSRSRTNEVAVSRGILWVREFFRLGLTVGASFVYIYIFMACLQRTVDFRDIELLVGLFLPGLVAVLSASYGFYAGTRN